MRRILIAALLTNLLLPVPLGLANHTTSVVVTGKAVATDPDDSDSRLDIARIVFSGDGGGVATLKARTHDRWDCDYYSAESEGLEQQGGRYGDLEWRFESPSGEQASGSFRCKEDGSLIFRIPDRDVDGTVWNFPATKPDDRTVVTEIDLSYLRLSGHSLSAYVYTEINGLHDEGVVVGQKDASPRVRLRSP